MLKTVYRGHNSYRHRRCVYCGCRFSTQERPVRWSRVDRKWPGLRPSRKGWRKSRSAALCGKCEIESCGVVFKQSGISRHADHIVPARLIRRLKAGNPDRRENLQCVCGSCHGCKLQADHKLCLGDKLGYLEILRTHNFDLPRDERAIPLQPVIPVEEIATKRASICERRRPVRYVGSIPTAPTKAFYTEWHAVRFNNKIFNNNWT